MFGSISVLKYAALSATCLLFCVSLVSSEGYSSPDSYETSVLILGAGAAGLQAARTLLEKNFTDFIILEGTNRTGGVLHNIQFGGQELASGHMRLLNPDLQHAEKHNIGLTKVNYDSFMVLNDHGQDMTDMFKGRYDAFEEADQGVYNIAEMVLAGQRVDISQKTALAMSGWVASTPLDRLVEWTELDFEEGIQSKRIPITAPFEFQHMMGAKEDGMMMMDEEEEYIITDYNQGFFPDVHAQLVEGKNLKFNKVVQNIDQSGDKVVVTLQGNHQFTADYVLVTFSIGVLQQGRVTFTPDLPPWKTEQIFRYQRGTIDPIFLKFSSNFWGSKEWIWHASDRNDVDRHYYPGFLNLEAEGYYPDCKMLVAFATGEEALRVEGLSDGHIADEILGVLQAMFGEKTVSTLEEIYVERWASDPFHHGLFSTWPLPSNTPVDADQRLGAKVDRVFFANHASDPFIGLTSGSIGSSITAMEQMSACIRGEECPEYEPDMSGNMGMGGGDDGDDDQLYSCIGIRIPKKEGKTRKVPPVKEEPNFTGTYGK